MLLFVNLFEYAWKPFYLSHYEDADAKQLFSRVFTYFSLCCAFVFLASSLFLTDIVQFPSIGGRLINPNYYEGLSIIPIILGAYFFSGVYNNFAVGIQISKKTKYFVYSMLVAGGVNIGLNLIFVPIFGYKTAAWTTLIGYLVAAVNLYFYSRKVYAIEYEWKRVISLFIICLLIYFGASLLIDFEFSLINISIKILALILFVFTLKVTGFFTSAEINQIKKLIPKRK